MAQPQPVREQKPKPIKEEETKEVENYVMIYAGLGNQSLNVKLSECPGDSMDDIIKYAIQEGKNKTKPDGSPDKAVQELAKSIEDEYIRVQSILVRDPNDSSEERYLPLSLEESAAKYFIIEETTEGTKFNLIEILISALHEGGVERSIAQHYF